MFKELNAILNWPDPYFPSGQLILVKDTLHADGSVLLHHFLCGYLKADKSACVVAFEQSFFHYFSAARKLARTHPSCSTPNSLNQTLTSPIPHNQIQAVNLKTAQTKNKLNFINGITAPFDWAAPSATSVTPPASPGNDNFTFDTKGE